MSFLTATCGYKNQDQENPPDAEQEEEEDIDPLEEKVESNVSASP